MWYRVPPIPIRCRVIQMTLLLDKSFRYKVRLLTFLLHEANRAETAHQTVYIKLKGMVN